MFGLVDNPSILIQVSRIISQIFGSDTQDVQNTIGNLERSQAFESDEIKTQRFDILLQQLEEE
jgi:hypothetical protein